MWSILAALHPAGDHVDRVSKYKPFENELNFEGIEFPVKMEDRVINKFERMNNISVNIYSYDKDIYPLRITQNRVDKHINLLYIKHTTNSHYCWIKDLSKLLSSQLTDHNGRIYPCERCLLFFHSEKDLQSHETDCRKNTPVKIVMPSTDSTLKFKNYKKSLRAAFVMYAYFECLTTKIDTCQPEENVSFTQKYQKHESTNFSLYIKYKHGDYKPPVEYIGPNATKVFYDMLRREALEIKKIYDHVYPIKMTAEDEAHFQRTDKCHICKWDISKYPSPYSSKEHVDFEKVRDHDHLLDPSKYASNYRGPAHMLCNINYQEPSFITVFIHNMSGYDAHLFIRELGADNEPTDVIPSTDEKYISFSKEVGSKTAVVAGKNVKIPGKKLRFVDSFRFMNSSLDSLAKNVKEFRETAKYFPKDKLDLVTRKGVYPYDYMDSWEKYEETRLPNKKEFYSKLNEVDISDEDYEHAKTVWKAFDIKNLGEYSNLYVKTDVLILADVMEHFRDVCMDTYNLDPAWYFSAPGLSWDAMLKTTKVRLELLDDYDMILMLEKGTRGGISQCCNRYGKANNKYMNDYNESKESNYLMYLDANNLYGWAMSQCLPYGGFRWGDNDVDVTKIPDDAVVGCIIECDLEYPEYLHDLHSDLPLAPENRIPDGSKHAKLLTTLHHKEHYVVHYIVLKQYLQKGS
ncbi:uncharacterized protein TNCV_2735101 [Trichonephila clavipes]|nr:uncharacterized protein TNCV_2735101 [Trichonephila clavipes]